MLVWLMVTRVCTILLSLEDEVRKGEIWSGSSDVASEANGAQTRANNIPRLVDER